MSYDSTQQGRLNLPPIDGPQWQIASSMLNIPGVIIGHVQPEQGPTSPCLYCKGPAPFLWTSHLRHQCLLRPPAESRGTKAKETRTLQAAVLLPRNPCLRATFIASSPLFFPRPVHPYTPRPTPCTRSPLVAAFHCS